MPKLSGIDLARTLEKTPMIIFVTAYPEFAVEGFELDAVDYLVKPVAFERFIKAVNKARDIFLREKKPENHSAAKRYIILKSDKKIYKVDESDIRYIQSYGDYIKVYTPDKMIIAMETLKNIERYLAEKFVRIHKSFIVSLDSIRYIEGNQVKIEGGMLPIGHTYKEEFLEKLKKRL
jgi:DNA-binding LytR/AlgR family response regulator